MVFKWPVIIQVCMYTYVNQSCMWSDCFVFCIEEGNHLGVSQCCWGSDDMDIKKESIRGRAGKQITELPTISRNVSVTRISYELYAGGEYLWVYEAKPHVSSLLWAKTGNRATAESVGKTLKIKNAAWKADGGCSGRFSLFLTLFFTLLFFTADWW